MKPKTIDERFEEFYDLAGWLEKYLCSFKSGFDERNIQDLSSEVSEIYKSIYSDIVFYAIEPNVDYIILLGLKKGLVERIRGFDGRIKLDELCEKVDPILTKALKDRTQKGVKEIADMILELTPYVTSLIKQEIGQGDEAPRQVINRNRGIVEDVHPVADKYHFYPDGTVEYAVNCAPSPEQEEKVDFEELYNKDPGALDECFEHDKNYISQALVEATSLINNNETDSAEQMVNKLRGYISRVKLESPKGLVEKNRGFFNTVTNYLRKLDARIDNKAVEQEPELKAETVTV